MRPSDKRLRPNWPPRMHQDDPQTWDTVYEITLPNGDTATAENINAAMLAVEQLLEDALKDLRSNVVIRKNGQIDSAATEMAQTAGMLV